MNMNQMTLEEEVKRHRHNTDPPTSEEAARKMIRSGKIKGHQAQLLNLIIFYPNCTAGELSGKGLLDYYQIMRRTNELEKLNLIEISGQKKCPVRKSMCSTWRIKENNNG